jgi:hypothetical protein
MICLLRMWFLNMTDKSVICTVLSYFYLVIIRANLFSLYPTYMTGKMILRFTFFTSEIRPTAVR